MLEGLIWLIVTLGVTALVGHGLWLLMAAVLKAILGEAPKPNGVAVPGLGRTPVSQGSQAACPVCTAPMPAMASRCDECGWPGAEPSPERRKKIALERLRKLAERFRKRDWLDQATFNAVRDTLRSVDEPIVLDAPEVVSPDAAPPQTVSSPAVLPPLADPSTPAVPSKPAASSTPVAASSSADSSTSDPRAGATPPAGDAAAPDSADYDLGPVWAPAGSASAAGRSSPPPLPQSAATPSQPVSPADDVSQRAAAYAARRAEGAAAAATSPPTAPRAPQPPPSRLLASFLEEKNIRWGELIGGLLILGSSIALVLSFWRQISERPELKFGLLNGVTASLFGIGLYVHRRWRLPTTTEGVLLIAVLLVPLNFLAIAAVTLTNPTSSPLLIGGELASIGLFAVLTFLAARILVGGGENPDGFNAAGTNTAPANTAGASTEASSAGGDPTRASATVGEPAIGDAAGMTLAVVGCAAWQLLVRRFVDAGSSTATLSSMALAPILAYGGNVVWGTRRVSRRATCGEVDAHRLFKIVGATLFAALLPLGVLLVKREAFLATLARLSPLVALLGAPLVAAGLTLRRRLAGRSLEGHRVIATSLAVAGAGVMLAAVAVGWPRPAGMLPTAVINAGLLAWIAWRSQLPAAHVPAALSCVFAYLLAFQVFVERQLDWSNTSAEAAFTTLLSGISGTALVPAAILLALPLIVTRRRTASEAAGPVDSGQGRHVEPSSGLVDGESAAVWYAAAAGITAVVSLVLVAMHSLGKNDDIYATWVYLAYAVAAILAAARTGVPALGYVGAALLWGSLAQGLAFRYVDQLEYLKNPWPYVFLGHATVSLLAALVFERRAVSRRGAAQPLAEGAQVSAVLVVPILSFAAYSGITFDAAGGFTWLAVIGGLIVARTMSREWFGAFQACCFAAAALWAYWFVGRSQWFANPAIDYLRSLDPRTWQAIGTAWAVLCCGWLALRRAIYRAEAKIPPAVASDPLAVIQPSRTPCTWSRLLAHDGPMVDRGVARALVGLVVALALYAVVPGVCQELSPRIAPPGGSRIVPPIAGFELHGIPHAPAYAWGSWLLAAAVGAMSLFGLADRFRPTKLVGLAAIGVAAALLVAARFETEVAAASALRWTTSAAFCLLSIPFWLPAATRRRVAQGLGIRRPEGAASLREPMFWVVLGLSLAPQLAMLVGMGWAAVERHPASPDMWPALLACVVIGLVGGALATLLLAIRVGEPGTQRQTTLAGSILIILSAAPVAAMGIFVVAVALKASPVLGPDPGSWFLRSGLAVSYALPVLLIAATLVGHAIATRSHAKAFAAALVLHFGATAGYLLAVAAGANTPLVFDLERWLRLAQLNAAVGAAYAIVWLLAPRLRYPAAGSDAEAAAREPPSLWQSVETGLACALAALAVGAPALVIAARPHVDYGILAAPATAADPAAWIALAAAIAAAMDWFRRAGRAPSVAAWSLSALGLVTMVALAGARYDQGDLFANRLLVAVWTTTAAALIGLGIVADRRGSPRFGPARSVARWSTAIVVAVLAAATFGLIVHQEYNASFASVSSAWYAVPLTTTVAALAVLACWIDSRWRLYAAALGWEFLVLLWSVEMFADWLPTPRPSLPELGWQLFIGLALPTPLWLWLDRMAARSSHSVATHSRAAQSAATHSAAVGTTPRRRSWLPAVHRVTSLLSLGILVPVVFNGVINALDGFGTDTETWLYGVGVAVMLWAVVSCLWDPRAWESVVALYLAGLVAVGAVLDHLPLEPYLIGFVGVMFLAAYGLATSYLWSRRGGLAQLAGRMGVPQADRWSPRGARPAAGQRWMIGANFVLAAVIIAAAYYIVLVYNDATQRLIAANAVFAQAVAVALLARGERRSILQLAALHLGVLGIVAFGWALVDPASEGNLLNRAVVATAALAATVGLYGIGFSKLLRRANEWTAAAARLVPRLIVGTGAALAFVLADEAYQFFENGHVAIARTAIFTVVAALVGLVAASLAAALLPGRDPLGLSEKGRTVYVYAAEAILALLFMHVRLTMPELFSGWFMQYWPVIIMVLAFIGVGLGEFFRRQSRTVLSEPLERTGAFLPLLPVFGFAMLPNQVNYSLLLFAVGLLYGVLSVARKSFGFGMLATLAANGGLWYFLADQERFGFFEHPQLWLIPPALCVLVAAHLNRRALSDDQQTTIRYGAASTIYIASTADIFLAGVAEAWALPLVLGGLALVGVFAGIAMRVRAFLFLGTGFLLLALMTIIYRAGVYEDQTWIFYVTGIVVGVLIITLFAVFEKKRHEVLRLLEELREWEK